MENEEFVNSFGNNLQEGMSMLAEGLSVITQGMQPMIEFTRNIVQYWGDFAAGMEDWCKQVEEDMMEKFSRMEEMMWGNLKSKMEEKQRRNQEVLKGRWVQLLEEKMHRTEKRLKQALDGKFLDIEIRLRNLEQKVAAVTRHDKISEAVPMELSEDATGDRKLGACASAVPVSGELDARVTVLESAVQKAICLMLPRVDSVLEQLETQQRQEATETNCAEAVPAPAEYNVLPTSYTYHAPTTGLTSLDRELLLNAANGRLSNVRKLLDSGANVNVHDGLGFAPLHLAARKAHADLVELLLARGADVEGGGMTRMTPLHWAAIEGCYSCISMLIRAGANVHAKTSHGWTSLHFACTMSSEVGVELLLDAGADYAARTVNGTTPAALICSETIRRLFQVRCLTLGNHNHLSFH